MMSCTVLRYIMLGFMLSCSAAWRRSATLGFSNTGIRALRDFGCTIKLHRHAPGKRGIQYSGRWYGKVLAGSSAFSDDDGSASGYGGASALRRRHFNRIDPVGIKRQVPRDLLH